MNEEDIAELLLPKSLYSFKVCGLALVDLIATIALAGAFHDNKSCKQLMSCTDWKSCNNGTEWVYSCVGEIESSHCVFQEKYRRKIVRGKERRILVERKFNPFVMVNAKDPNLKAVVDVNDKSGIYIKKRTKNGEYIENSVHIDANKPVYVTGSVLKRQEGDFILTGSERFNLSISQDGPKPFPKFPVVGVYVFCTLMFLGTRFFPVKDKVSRDYKLEDLKFTITRDSSLKQLDIITFSTKTSNADADELIKLLLAVKKKFKILETPSKGSIENGFLELVFFVPKNKRRRNYFEIASRFTNTLLFLGIVIAWVDYFNSNN
mmetsp:Transcript_5375/g.8912  ORF Transcript_5375/g.8912 Transcript_5375/m.8912 type:complete len:320 (-) Transcript_5375:15-974(-)